MIAAVTIYLLVAVAFVVSLIGRPAKLLLIAAGAVGFYADLVDGGDASFLAGVGALILTFAAICLGKAARHFAFFAMNIARRKNIAK